MRVKPEISGVRAPRPQNPPDGIDQMPRGLPRGSLLVCDHQTPVTQAAVAEGLHQGRKGREEVKEPVRAFALFASLG